MAKYTPHDYQKECMKFMLERPAAAAFLDPGEGKTSITLGVLDTLKKFGDFDGVLVVATLKIMDHEVWSKEIKKWGFDFTHTMLHGKDKDKNLKKKVDIYFINYEGLSWLKSNIKKLKANILVLDESSKIKSWRSNRFKILKTMLPKFNRRYLLTGTPASQNYMDLFSQIFIIDEGEALGKYITHFKNQYFTPSGFKGYKYEIQKGAAERIYKAISPLVYRTSEDFLKIPVEKYNDVYLNMPDDADFSYREMEKEFVTELEKGEVTAVSAGAMHMKLRQMANGRVYDEAGNILVVHEEKKQAAIDYVEELQGSPCLIGYEFKHDLEALKEAFPTAAFIGSGVKKEVSLRVEKMWNMGKIPILIGQISSVAHGLNLQESGHNLMFYSHMHKLEDVIQFIRRLRRQGQKKRVIVTRLIMRGTIDESVIAGQEAKHLSQSALLDAMRKRVKSK